MNEAKNVKISFGLQQSHIEIIESEIERWNNIETKPVFNKDGKEIKVNMMYSKSFWDSTARLVDWCPFTLCLDYFEYLSKRS